jgi:hypothetical protein
MNDSTKSVSQLIPSLNQTSEKPKPSKDLEEKWPEVWMKLQAMNLVWEELDSSTSLYWMASLKDLGVESVMYGLREAKSFTGSLTMGKFRKMCAKTVSHPSHHKFEAIEHKAASPEYAKENLRKLREDLKL